MDYVDVMDAVDAMDLVDNMESVDMNTKCIQFLTHAVFEERNGQLA
jgi:hypothetical protein